jgi:hypothetical protein
MEGPGTLRSVATTVEIAVHLLARQLRCVRVYVCGCVDGAKGE